VAPVLAAFERPAAWLVQHGGGPHGSAVDVVSTYGLHLLFLAALLAGGFVLHRLHRAAVEAPERDPQASFPGGRAGSPTAILFPYEAAYLAGGQPRVVEAALSALLEEGWIESTPSGRLQLGGRGDLVTSPDPVGIPVLSVVASAPPTASREIRRRAAHLTELHDVSRILYARRLLVSEPVQRRLRRLRWAATGVLALAAAGLIAVAAVRSADLLSSPVVLAAACLVFALIMPALAWPRPLFRTALGDAELAAVCCTVTEKARWVSERLWTADRSADDGPWSDVDKIADALQRPAASRPVQLAWLWGREDALMAIAVRGPRGIPDVGLRRGLNGHPLPESKNAIYTGLLTPVHKMMSSDDA
jgi:uncharacterized protein (TIGR04222 family)